MYSNGKQTIGSSVIRFELRKTEADYETLRIRESHQRIKRQAIVRSREKASIPETVKGSR
jgi:hypothetical protein